MNEHVALVFTGILCRLGARSGLVHHLMRIVLADEHQAVLAVVPNDRVGCGLSTWHRDRFFE